MKSHTFKEGDKVKIPKSKSCDAPFYSEDFQAHYKNINRDYCTISRIYSYGSITVTLHTAKWGDQIWGFSSEDLEPYEEINTAISIESILEECNRRYAVGMKVKCLDGWGWEIGKKDSTETSILSKKPIISYCKNKIICKGSLFTLTLYKDGKYAEILPIPKVEVKVEDKQEYKVGDLVVIENPENQGLSLSIKGKIVRIKEIKNSVFGNSYILFEQQLNESQDLANARNSGIYIRNIRKADTQDLIMRDQSVFLGLEKLADNALSYSTNTVPVNPIEPYVNLTVVDDYLGLPKLNNNSSVIEHQKPVLLKTNQRTKKLIIINQ